MTTFIAVLMGMTTGTTMAAIGCASPLLGSVVGLAHLVIYQVLPIAAYFLARGGLV